MARGRRRAGAGRGPRDRHPGVRGLVLFAVVASVLPAAASERCVPGTYVAHRGPRLVPGATGTYDVVRFDGAGRDARVAIAATCPAVRARGRGRRVRATWPSGACGVPERIRLTGELDADCQVLRGRLRRGGRPGVALVAARCADDGIVRADAGEACATAGACGPDQRCIDCRCVPAVDFRRDVQPIFRSCLTLACHEGPRPTGAFSLEPGAAHGALLGGVAGRGPCAGRALVVPGAPDASVLMARVGGGTCGARMPIGPVSLPAAEVDTLRAWISQGAPGG